MATNPPDQNPPPPSPEPEPQGNPWETWQHAGIDPSYDPHQARQALGFWDALRNRDQREHAIEQLVRNDLLPEGMSLREAREYLQQAVQEDPWDALNPQAPAPVYEPPYEGQPQYQQAPQPPLDPSALRQAIDAEMDRRFQDFQRQQQEAQLQQQAEQEFVRELDRVASQNNLEDDEKLWVAAQANYLRQSMPYATTGQVLDEAGKRFTAHMTRRLQALAQAQATQTPQTGVAPAGPTPSANQPPRSLEEAERMHREMMGG